MYEPENIPPEHKKSFRLLRTKTFSCTNSSIHLISSPPPPPHPPYSANRLESLFQWRLAFHLFLVSSISSARFLYTPLEIDLFKELWLFPLLAILASSLAPPLNTAHLQLTTITELGYRIFSLSMPFMIAYLLLRSNKGNTDGYSNSADIGIMSSFFFSFLYVCT